MGFFESMTSAGVWGILLCLFFVFMGAISPVMLLGLIFLTGLAFYLGK